MSDQENQQTRHIRVWDRFIRCFHWLLASGFAACFVSGLTGAMTVHTWAGYGVSVLVVARIIKGLVGSGHARFSSFVYGPRATMSYLRSLLGQKPLHYLGHNPAGAQMVFALLVLMIILVTTGMANLATIDFEGPLLFISRWADDATAYRLQDIHELMPWVVLGFVSLHVAGVVASSRIHHENLVRSMVTGIKDIPPGITPQDEKRTSP